MKKHVPVATKICADCKEEKPASAFSPDSRQRSGLKTRCRECINSYNRNRHKENPILNRESGKRYRSRHPHTTWAHSSYGFHNKKYTVKFTREWLKELALSTTKCTFCGSELYYLPMDGKDLNHRPTLDRINNETTLTKDNVRIICHRCNISKNNRTAKEFVQYCKVVYENNKSLLDT